jgi:hypothetical protein
MRDEGWPLGPGLQDQGPNHRMLLWSNGRGGERYGKGRARLCQVRAEETNVSEPLMSCRKRRNDVKTRGVSLTWDEVWALPVYGPCGIRHESGVTSVQALVWNVGTCVSMLRKQLKWKPHQSLSTDAKHRDGVARSSVEGSVMEPERRRDTVQLCYEINRQRKESCG